MRSGRILVALGYLLWIQHTQVRWEWTCITSMSTGIRATVKFTSGDLCPVVELSRTADTTIDSASTNVWSGEDAECVTEFSVDVEEDADLDTGLEPVFAHGPTRQYRYAHDGDDSCPCELIGKFGCPVVRYVAREGSLTLVFHATDYDQLQKIVTELREHFPDVDIERLVRSPVGDHHGDSVFIDRGKLTARQLEVLETAYEMGYFERPRQANATEIADTLGINPSTFSEHLAAAQAKLLEDIV
jgi:predicted DNA binding protein